MIEHIGLEGVLKFSKQFLSSFFPSFCRTAKDASNFLRLFGEFENREMLENCFHNFCVASTTHTDTEKQNTPARYNTTWPNSLGANALLPEMETKPNFFKP